MGEIQFREPSADTNRIKYNTKGIKTRTSKNINLSKVKRKHSWFQGNNKIQQHLTSSKSLLQMHEAENIANRREKQNHVWKNYALW